MEPGERKRCREAEETTGRDSKRNKMEIEAEEQTAPHPHQHHIILSVEETNNVHSHPVVPREYKLDTNLDIWVEETESVVSSPYTVKRYIWDMTIATSPLLIILVSLSLVVLPLIKNSFFSLLSSSFSFSPVSSANYATTRHSLIEQSDILSLNSNYVVI